MQPSSWARVLAAALLIPLAACGSGDEADTDLAPTDGGTDTVPPDDDLDGDGYAAPDDCDDARADVHPGADERCDGIDHDCDGLADEDTSLDALEWYTDADGDGWGDSRSSVRSCIGPPGTVLTDGDCDDTDAGLQRDDADADGIDSCDGDCDDLDAAVHPGAAEVCNGVNDDCANGVDDGFEHPIWYLDADGDGYGDPAAGIPSCLDLSPGRTLDATDCDDADAAANHDDADADGTDSCNGDCDDLSTDVRPGAPDPIDGVDTDCDGADGVLPRVWAAERYTGDVWEIDRATGAASVAWSGLGDMIGIARASDGRMWVSRYATGTVAELHPDGTFTDVFAGFVGPHGLSWDPAAQTLLLADWLTDSVYELDPADGSVAVLASGLADPISAVRFPGLPDVWVGQRASAQILVIDATGGTRVGATLPRTGTDTLVVSDGLLYTVGQWQAGDGGPIYRVDPATGVVTAWSPSLSASVNDQTEICLDPGGPGLLGTTNAGGGAIWALDGAATLLNGDPAVPWQCAGNLPFDGDGDGAYALRVGGDDCDDADPAVLPGQGPVPSTWYLDADGDGWGDPQVVERSCLDLSPGYSRDATDCDDTSAAANHEDADGDGFDTCGGDCDDRASDVYPGAPDAPDGVDQSCDGTDGFAPRLWVAERYTGDVWEIDRATGAASVAWSGLGDMIGIARASDGRMWVSRYAAGTVAELHPDGTFTDVFVGFSGPHALSWDDAAGTLLLASPNTDEVWELDPADGSATLLAGGLADPISAVRFPGGTDVWVAQRASPDVLVIDAAGGRRVGATLPGPGADTIVVADGALFTSGLYSPVTTGEIERIDPVTGAVTDWADALPGASTTQAEICLDPGGPGLIAAYGTSRVSSITEAGAPVDLSTAPVLPWQCVGNIPPDGDGDGFYAVRVGGDDCDDGDAAVFPGQGC